MFGAYAEITSHLRHHEVLISTQKFLEIMAIVRSGAQFAIEISLYMTLLAGGRKAPIQNMSTAALLQFLLPQLAASTKCQL